MKLTALLLQFEAKFDCSKRCPAYSGNIWKTLLFGGSIVPLWIFRVMVNGDFNVRSDIRPAKGTKRPSYQACLFVKPAILSSPAYESHLPMSYAWLRGKPCVWVKPAFVLSPPLCPVCLCVQPAYVSISAYDLSLPSLCQARLCVQPCLCVNLCLWFKPAFLCQARLCVQPCLCVNLCLWLKPAFFVSSSPMCPALPWVIKPALCQACLPMRQAIKRLPMCQALWIKLP